VANHLVIEPSIQPLHLIYHRFDADYTEDKMICKVMKLFTYTARGIIGQIFVKEFWFFRHSSRRTRVTALHWKQGLWCWAS